MSSSIRNERYAIVNRSGTNIPVYDRLVPSTAHAGSQTVSDNQIGFIAPNEFYTVLPNVSSYITSFEIIFRDAAGAVKHGFIETSPGFTLDDYAWSAYQEPYNYYNSNGATLVTAAREVISGISYNIFTIHEKPLIYRNSTGVSQGTLPVGTRLATNSSTTGQTYGGYMIFYKKKLPGNAWQNLILEGPSGYGFVNLGLSTGSMPSDRPVW